MQPSLFCEAQEDQLKAIPNVPFATVVLENRFGYTADLTPSPFCS
jgi:hypothetical protein